MLNPFVSNILTFLLIPVLFVCSIFLSRKFVNSVSSLYSIPIVRLFIIGSLSFLALAISYGLLFPNAAMDLQLHDTYFVIVYFNILILNAILLGIWALVYYLAHAFIKRRLILSIGQFHFYVTYIGVLAILSLSQYSLTAGVPRRYYSFNSYDSTFDLLSVNRFITIIVLLVLFAQFTFIINLILSLIRNRNFGQTHQ